MSSESGNTGPRQYEAGSRSATLIGRFDEQAAATPHRVALVGPERSLTFGEVDDLAAVAGSALLSRYGAGREPVALQFDHDVQLVVAILAVMRSGRPFTVLDPQAPAALNAAVLADSTAVALVHDDAQARGATATAGSAAVPWSELFGGARGATWPVEAGDPALLAYTSGTTGAAKAATIPHRALVHLMDGATRALGISEDERMPMLFPLSLAVATYPMFLPLVNGGSLHTFDMRSLGLAPFPSWLVDQRISLIYFSPTVARFLEEAAVGHRFDGLRQVVLGGERVDDDAIAVVRHVFGSHVTVANGYGTTETGVLCFHETDPDRRYGEAGVPVGTPIPGMEIVLVDGEGVPVDEGEVGELVVHSEYLLTGYWGRPDLDDLVLGTDRETGVPTYRTGDLGRWRDGVLELVGRSDSEVKVRGQRVVPGEVEQVLLALPEVKDAAVGTRRVSIGSNEVLAWVVVAEGSTIDSVRSALGDRVKAAFVPTTFVEVDALPLLPNGKLDRRSLPAPPGGRPPGLGPYVPPATEDQHLVVGVWEQIFGVRPIGIADRFDALGGRSLDAAQMVVMLEDQHGIILPMADLLEAMTPELVAARIVHARSVASGVLARSSITVITPPKTEVPMLYFVHDLHGSAYSLRFLASALGDRPLAGFESPFLDAAGARPRRLEDLASRYVADVIAAQPEGPYHLAGYSFGGVLAFEMARQLMAKGHEVAELVILDVGPGYRGRHFHPRRAPAKPTLSVPMPPEAAGWAATVRWYLELARRSPSDAAQSMVFLTRLDRTVDRLRNWSDLRRHGSVRPSHRLWDAWQQHWELGRAYSWEGRRYEGPATLVWADETGSTDATMGWGGIIDELEIVRVAVDHEAFLLPDGARVIASVLQRSIVPQDG